jgi:hypothetical protein
MAATLAGLLKAHLEAQGLNITVYRDGAPADTPHPLVVVTDGIAMAPEHHGDHADASGHQGEQEQAQVDLYQLARVPDPAHAGSTLAGESRTLALEIRRRLPLLARASYGTPPVRVYGLVVAAGRRWPVADNIVRNTWTVTVRRDA